MAQPLRCKIVNTHTQETSETTVIQHGSKNHEASTPVRRGLCEHDLRMQPVARNDWQCNTACHEKGGSNFTNYCACNANNESPTSQFFCTHAFFEHPQRSKALVPCHRYPWYLRHLPLFAQKIAILSLKIASPLQCEL